MGTAKKVGGSGDEEGSVMKDFWRNDYDRKRIIKSHRTPAQRISGFEKEKQDCFPLLCYNSLILCRMDKYRDEGDCIFPRTWLADLRHFAGSCGRDLVHQLPLLEPLFRPV